MRQAYHGGAFFKAIGPDFSSLERSESVISADVLDAWFPPSPRAVRKVAEHLPFLLSTSPPTHAEGLVQTIAHVRGVRPECVLTGGGSSDLIFLLLQHLVKRGDRVLILDPMYGEYAHVLEHVIGAQVVRHMLLAEDDFQLNLAVLTRQIQAENPSVVILVNPNSPTGQHVPKDRMLALLTEVSPNVTVLVDETYVEYVGVGQSLESEVDRFENLVVVKSMSKAYALSGARVGYLVGSSGLIEALSPFSPPWSVSLVAQVAAVEALKDAEYYSACYAETHCLRDELSDMVSEVAGLKVFPSVANFLLAECSEGTKSASEIVSALRAQDIFLRHAGSMSQQFGDRFFRVAIKNRVANQRVVRALRECLVGKAAVTSER